MKRHPTYLTLESKCRPCRLILKCFLCSSPQVYNIMSSSHQTVRRKKYAHRLQNAQKKKRTNGRGMCHEPSGPHNSSWAHPQDNLANMMAMAVLFPRAGYDRTTRDTRPGGRRLRLFRVKHTHRERKLMHQRRAPDEFRHRRQHACPDPLPARRPPGTYLMLTAVSEAASAYQSRTRTLWCARLVSPAGG